MPRRTAPSAPVARMGSSARRPVDLRARSEAEALATPATWRCVNPSCGVFVIPSRAEHPGCCHLCDTPKAPAG